MRCAVQRLRRAAVGADALGAATVTAHRRGLAAVEVPVVSPVVLFLAPFFELGRRGRRWPRRVRRQERHTAAATNTNNAAATSTAATTTTTAAATAAAMSK